MEQQKHICKNCSNEFVGKYCNLCGEKVFQEKDKTLLSFGDEALHFLTHLDGKFFTTSKTMFSSPGLLSEDFCNGKKVKYFKPLSFFLLIVILYLFFPMLEGLNMKLKYFPMQDYYGNYAAQKISDVQLRTGFSLDLIGEKFHQKGEKVSKLLLLIIIPFTAFFFWIFGFKKRKYLYDHLIFASELNAFYLLWGFLILPLLLALIIKIGLLFGLKNLYVTDEVIGVIMYLIMLIYTSIAMRRFFHFKWGYHFLFLILFYFAHTFIVYSLYKFLLFVITINQIH